MSGFNKLDRELSAVDELSETRLWKMLDTISERLTGIESKLSDVIRLEEKVNSHDQALARYGSRLDSHEHRLRDSELWQAHQGDKSLVEKQIAYIKSDLDGVKTDLNTIKNTSSENKGEKTVFKDVFKWLTYIFAGIIIYMITRGSDGV